MKKTRGSGGFRRLELAADRFFDVERFLAIVLGEISDRLARLVAVCNDGRRHGRRLQDGPAEFDSRVHRDDARLRGFFGRRSSTPREGIEARDEPVFVPLDTLEMQTNQIAHRELSVPRRIDHILQTYRFNEQMLAVGEHLVVHERVLRPKLFTKISNSAANLWQLQAVLPPQGVENVRLRQVVEGQPRALRIGEFDDRLRTTSAAGAQRIRAPGKPRSGACFPESGGTERPRRRCTAAFPGPAAPSTAVPESDASCSPRDNPNLPADPRQLRIEPQGGPDKTV